jgi:hypothetical protein
MDSVHHAPAKVGDATPPSSKLVRRGSATPTRASAVPSSHSRGVVATGGKNAVLPIVVIVRIHLVQSYSYPPRDPPAIRSRMLRFAQIGGRRGSVGCGLRSSIQTRSPIRARPPFSLQSLFLIGSRIHAAAPILARTSVETQLPNGHCCASGYDPYIRIW